MKKKNDIETIKFVKETLKGLHSLDQYKFLNAFFVQDGGVKIPKELMDLNDENKTNEYKINLIKVKAKGKVRGLLNSFNMIPEQRDMLLRNINKIIDEML